MIDSFSLFGYNKKTDIESVLRMRNYFMGWSEDLGPT